VIITVPVIIGRIISVIAPIPEGVIVKGIIIAQIGGMTITPW